MLKSLEFCHNQNIGENYRNHFSDLSDVLLCDKKLSNWRIRTGYEKFDHEHYCWDNKWTEDNPKTTTYSYKYVNTMLVLTINCCGKRLDVGLRLTLPVETPDSASINLLDLTNTISEERCSACVSYKKRTNKFQTYITCSTISCSSFFYFFITIIDQLLKKWWYWRILTVTTEVVKLKITELINFLRSDKFWQDSYNSIKNSMWPFRDVL